MLEFFFDTTRAVVDLVLNGTVGRNPDLRIHRPARRRNPPHGCRPGQRVRAHRSLPRSTCSAISVGSTSTWPGLPLPRQLDALLTLTTLDHLHYGSDFPFTPEPVVADAAERIDGVGDPGSLVTHFDANTERLFTCTRLTTIERTNAMEHQIELGYLVLEVPDPDTLAPGVRRRGRPRARRADGIGA